MAVAPLTGQHMQAKGYRRGRERMKWGRVVFLVVHTAEGGTRAEDLGNYFQTTTRQVSSHCGIGQDGHYVTYVSYADTAWTAAPINDDGDQVELLGWARWTRAEWLERRPMLNTLAHWLAWRSEVRQIPLVVLSAAEAKAGRPGILMHRTVTEAWPEDSSHTDPGRNLPWDYVLDRARELLMADLPDAPAYNPDRQNPWRWDGIEANPLPLNHLEGKGRVMPETMLRVVYSQNREILKLLRAR